MHYYTKQASIRNIDSRALSTLNSEFILNMEWRVRTINRHIVSSPKKQGLPPIPTEADEEKVEHRERSMNPG